MPPEPTTAAADAAPASTPATTAPAPTAVPAAAPAASKPSASEIVAALKADPLMHDAVMANLRRGGAMATPKVAAETNPQPTPPTTPSEAPSVAQTVRAELLRMRALDQAVIVAGVKPTAAQLGWMEEAFSAANPPDAAAWAARYVGEMFASTPSNAAPATTPVSQPATTAPVPAPAPTTPPAQPVTARGAPSATTENPDAIDFSKLTTHDRDALIRRIGIVEFIKRSNGYMRGVTVTR